MAVTNPSNSFLPVFTKLESDRYEGVDLIIGKGNCAVMVDFTEGVLRISSDNQLDGRLGTMTTPGHVTGTVNTGGNDSSREDIKTIELSRRDLPMMSNVDVLENTIYEGKRVELFSERAMGSSRVSTKHIYNNLAIASVIAGGDNIDVAKKYFKLAGVQGEIIGLTPNADGGITITTEGENIYTPGIVEDRMIVV